MQNPTDQAETSISTEMTARESPNLNRTFTVRRKIAKRSERWYCAPQPPPPQNIAEPLPPLPHAEDILEEPPPTTTKNEAARKTASAAASPDVSVGLPPPDDDDDDDDKNSDPVTDMLQNDGATARRTPEEDAKLITKEKEVQGQKRMSDHESLLTPSKKIDVPEYVKRGRRVDMKKYQQSTKGKVAQKAYNESRKKPVSRFLKISLNEILHNGMSIVKAEVLPLLLSPWESRCGLSFHMDAPMCNDSLCGIDRPGVMRTSYGKDCHESDEDDVDFVTRYVDRTGSGSNSFGTDPKSGQTKQMSLAMWELGVALQNQLRSRGTIKNCKTMDLSEEFNSVSILLYIGSDVIKECTAVSEVAYSNNMEFNTKGEFVKDNSQKENTPVVVLTLGDPRTLHMKKRKVGKDGGWMNNEKENKHDYLLKSGSIFVMHPEDEQLKTRGREGQGLSHFQHGVKVTKGLSMAIIFRTVTTKAKIHVINNTEKLRPRGEKRKSREEHYTDAYNDALKLKESMEDQLKKYVQTAKDNGTLF
jgi:hypothetical protein